MRKRIRNSLILIVVLVVVAGMVWAVPTYLKKTEKQRIQKQFYKAKRYTKSERTIEKGMERYRRIVEKYPESDFAPRAQLRIAQIHANLGEYQEAILACRKFLRDYPENRIAGYVQYMLGAIHDDKLGDYEEALKEYEKVIQNYPGHEQAVSSQYKIGKIYHLRFEDYERALKEYQKVIDDYPEGGITKQARERIEEIKRPEPRPLPKVKLEMKVAEPIDKRVYISKEEEERAREKK